MGCAGILYAVSERSATIATREMMARFDSADFKQGVAHFLENRAPAFTGR
jgi:enoyl-CoA hydratase/carnithine racemase